MLAALRRKRIGSLAVAGAFLLLVVIVVISFLLLRRGDTTSGPPVAGPADSMAVADPLPLRRLADQEGGELVLEAIEASGGWTAWSGRTAARLTFEGVFLDETGALRNTRTETHTLTLHPPARVRIEDGLDATVAGFGPDGPWGAARQSDGRWNPTAGPAMLGAHALRDMTLNAWWFFGLPFNLGETDAALHGPALRADGDSLARLRVAWPPSPGEATGREARLGFDPESGHILEIHFNGRGDERTSHYLLRISGYSEFEGIWRPTRRALFHADSTGAPLDPLYEQRLTGITWDPGTGDDLFDPPPPP